MQEVGFKTVYEIAAQWLFYSRLFCFTFVYLLLCKFKMSKNRLQGAAYGIAGIIKGLGILSLKQLDVMGKLTEAIQEKKNYKFREGECQIIDCNWMFTTVPPSNIQIKICNRNWLNVIVILVHRCSVRLRNAVLQAGPPVRAVHRACTPAPADVLRRQLAVRARRGRRHRQAHHEQTQRARR